MEYPMMRTQLAMFVAFTLPACGAHSVSPDGPAGSAVDLAGRWRSACTDPGSGQALRFNFDLTATTWALDYETFADATCATPALVIHIDGPYAVTGPSAAVASAYEARFAFTHKTVTPRSQGAAAFLAQACGGQTFAADTAADLSNGCAGLGAYPIASCAADYDLVLRAGSHLQFGSRPADNNMCSEARRPTAMSAIVLERL